MAKATTVHVCSSCGHQTPRWSGRCPGCGEWNTFVEERAPAAAPGGARGGGGGAGARGGARGGGRGAAAAAPGRPVRLADVDTTPVPRVLTGIGEFDRVLGGGI